MKQLKIKIICEILMIFGCLLIIGVYLGGILSGLIFSKSMFSDFWESTTITMLTIIILFYVSKDYRVDLKILGKEKKVFEESRGEIRIHN